MNTPDLSKIFAPTIGDLPERVRKQLSHPRKVSSKKTNPQKLSEILTLAGRPVHQNEIIAAWWRLNKHVLTRATISNLLSDSVKAKTVKRVSPGVYVAATVNGTPVRQPTRSAVCTPGAWVGPYVVPGQTPIPPDSGVNPGDFGNGTGTLVENQA